MSAERVVVVGAGVLGSSIAYRLALAGHDVHVIDAGARPGDGSTGASSAIVRFHYTLLENAALAWDSFPAWQDWAGELGGIDPAGMPVLRRTGALMLGRHSDFTRVIENFEDLGIAYELLDPQQWGRRWPHLDPASFAPPRRAADPSFFDDPTGDDLHGLYTPDGGYVNDPQRAAASYAWAATREGATVHLRARVTAITTRAGAVDGVTLADGTHIPARVVVNAAGPASDQLNQLAGVAATHTVRSRPLLTETHVVPAPPGFAGDAGVFVIDPDLGTAFRPEGSEQLHISTVEPACDPLHWWEDPWSFPSRPTADNYETQTLRVARRVRDLRIPNRPQGLAALYDVTPDWNPLLDHSDLPGFVLACGSSGNSFKTAPSIGRVVAGIVADELDGRRTTSHAELPSIHRRISLAPYGRHRQLGDATTVIA